MSPRKNKAFLDISAVLYFVLVVSLVSNVVLILNQRDTAVANYMMAQSVIVLSNLKSNDVSAVQPSVQSVESGSSVPIIVISDKRCVDCQTDGLMAKLVEVFPTAKFTVYDYSETAGRSLFKSLGLRVLPVVLFDSSVSSSSGYQVVSRYLSPVGSYQSLAIGSSFDPTAEICDNKADDNGDGLVDCGDPQCSSGLVCREHVAGKLDLFVMSKCPYGIQAENSLKSVLEAVKPVNFSLHFIASYDAVSDSFGSLHGQTEVDENLRQVCVMKYYPSGGSLMDYILCRNADINSVEWKKCALLAKISADKIEKCSQTDEGKKLLIDNIKLGEELGISASPTWLLNNYKQFSALSSDDIKSNFCSGNPSSSGCDKVLSNTTAVSGSC